MMCRHSADHDPRVHGARTDQWYGVVVRMSGEGQTLVNGASGFMGNYM
ncbi:MAG: hypothetical protein JWO42_3760 [Chloroflexi bacterium]|nr:hypothetical protein [Chloroflexota bacterium]